MILAPAAQEGVKLPPMSAPDLRRYCAAAVPAAFAGFPLYALAPDYYATTYGVPLSLMGALLPALRVLDALQDPLIGAFSDRRRGACRRIMQAGGLLMCVAVYALFNLSFGPPALWFTLCMAAAATGYSALSINLNALGALHAGGPADQLRTASAREAAGLAGLILAVSLPGVIGMFAPQEDRYLWFCLILAALTAATLARFPKWPTPPAEETEASRPSLRRAAFAAPPRETRRLLWVYGLSMTASSVPAVLVIFFVRDVLQAEPYTGLFLALYFVSGALAMPLWSKAGNRFGKTAAWQGSMALAAAALTPAFWAGPGDVALYGAVCVVSGAALGADLALPPAMLADSLRTGGEDSSRHAAARYALLALAGKLSLAVASAAALPAAELAGFMPNSVNAASSLTALAACYALIPSLLKLSACAAARCALPRGSQGENHARPFIDGPDGSSGHA